jgi:hypothetical protein
MSQRSKKNIKRYRNLKPFLREFIRPLVKYRVKKLEAGKKLFPKIKKLYQPVAIQQTAIFQSKIFCTNHVYFLKVH